MNNNHFIAIILGYSKGLYLDEINFKINTVRLSLRCHRLHPICLLSRVVSRNLYDKLWTHCD